MTVVNVQRGASKRLFGRRRGRPLRARGQALMAELLPRLAIAFSKEKGGLDPYALFDQRPQALGLEIGFGGGEHLAAQAARSPETGFIGCEPFVNGVAKLLSHVEAQGLRNVRVYPDDARVLLDALPEACLDVVFVLFADPWPKKRHVERRFIGPENLERLARVLKPGGALRLASDVEGLVVWMREAVAAQGAFELVYDGFDVPADWIPTRYEQKGRAAGRRPAYLLYRRR